MKIAVDAMGGDFAPEQIVFGAVRAAKKYGCEIVLVGDETQIREVLKREKGWEDLKITIHHTTEVIGMDEHPADAVRTKKDSSVVVATKLVKDGECDAVLSAGSTGAAVTAAQLILKRIRGIGRPTIATPIPTPKGVTLLLDSGANVDSKPIHLVQSGMMGSIYAEYVFGINKPKVGLLNIGEEETKGNEQAKETYPLLKAMHTINFCGNAEGRDIPKGSFDVVICDGFIGNVVLKFAEGLAKTIMKLIKEAIKDGGILAKLGALLLMPAFKKLGKKLDASEYGGAPLLGVNGVCIISHGSSNAKSICSAIGVANDYVNGCVLEHIKESLAREEVLTNDGEKNSAGILGTGWAVPDKVLTNFDLEKMVDTNDAWIVERTGISQRHVAPDDMSTSELAYRAAKMALEDAHTAPEELDLIIVATLTSDRIIPSTACVLQERLGAKKAAAFDLSAACSGFVYGSTVACQFIETGMYRKVLVIGAETLSKVVDWTDRNTCILFGDGAGAAVYGQVEADYGLLSFDLGSDGSGAEALDIPASGSLHPVTPELLADHMNFIHMDGKAVFRFAVKVMGKTVETALAKIAMNKDKIDWLVPHQANIRIIQAAAKRLHMPMEKVIVNVANYGNTSAASIPLALAEAAHAGKFKKGDVLALAGFGAGLTWASCVMRWAKED